MVTTKTRTDTLYRVLKLVPDSEPNADGFNLVVRLPEGQEPTPRELFRVRPVKLHHVVSVTYPTSWELADALANGQVQDFSERWLP